MTTEPAVAVEPPIPRHIPELDGLRGLAILLVIPHNAGHFELAQGWMRIPAAVANAGWIGVHLFFVLSGFLITRNLLESRGARHYLRAFYGRRALRILPLLYLLLVGVLFVVPRLVDVPQKITATYAYQVWIWTFLCNWVQSSGRTVYGLSHLWSLAVEEQFYAVWPFVVAWLDDRRFLGVCFAIVVIAIASRSAMLEAGALNQSIYNFTNCRMDALAIGAIAALAVRSPTAVALIRSNGTLALGAAVGMLAAVAVATGGYALTSPALIYAGYSVIAVAFAIVIALAAASVEDAPVVWLRALLSWAPLTSVGLYSYAMYLFHEPLALGFGSKLYVLLAPAGPAAPLLFAVAIAVASYALGFISYHLFERRVLALKRFLLP